MKREKHPEKVEQGGGGEEYLSRPHCEDDIEGSGACAMLLGAGGGDLSGRGNF